MLDNLSQEYTRSFGPVCEIWYFCTSHPLAPILWRFCTSFFEKPFGLLWVWGFILCIYSLYLFISTTLVHVWFVLCCTMLHSFALVLQIVQCLSLTEFSVFIWQRFTSIKHTGGDSSPKSSHFKSWKMWRSFAWENFGNCEYVKLPCIIQSNKRFVIYSPLHYIYTRFYYFSLLDNDVLETSKRRVMLYNILSQIFIVKYNTVSTGNHTYRVVRNLLLSFCLCCL